MDIVEPRKTRLDGQQMDTKSVFLWTPKWTPSPQLIDFYRIGAGRGTRTPTPFSRLRILSPSLDFFNINKTLYLQALNEFSEFVW